MDFILTRALVLRQLFFLTLSMDWTRDTWHCKPIFIVSCNFETHSFPVRSTVDKEMTTFDLCFRGGEVIEWDEVQLTGGIS